MTNACYGKKHDTLEIFTWKQLGLAKKTKTNKKTAVRNADARNNMLRFDFDEVWRKLFDHIESQVLRQNEPGYLGFGLF